MQKLTNFFRKGIDLKKFKAIFKSLFFKFKNLTSNKKKLKIGRNYLYLYSNIKHEFKYLNEKFNVDAMLADQFIKKNSLVIDVGANIGYCALQYLKNGAERVDAYEPNCEIFRRLKRLKINELNAFNLAISDLNGESNLFISQSHNQGHTLEKKIVDDFRWIFPENLKKQKVKLKTLDTIYCRGEIFDFIKIDVEGHELKILKGGNLFFKRCKKAILQIEIYNKESDQVFEELQKYYKYIYRVFYSLSIGKLYFSDLRDSQPIKNYTNNPPNYICSNKKLDNLLK